MALGGTLWIQSPTPLWLGFFFLYKRYFLFLATDTTSVSHLIRSTSISECHELAEPFILILAYMALSELRDFTALIAVLWKSL